MARKRWTKQEEETEALLKLREKRKWQIALRRYVLEGSYCYQYAPYFGLDTKNIRHWFELQFSGDQSWDNFGDQWQFDHIIPVTYFDFSSEEDLKLCWSFINLRVEPIKNNKDRGNRVDVLAAKGYFTDLYDHTAYPPCKKMLDKINQVALLQIVSTEPQKIFLKHQEQYLTAIKDYSVYEFEQLNRGRTVEDLNAEANMIKGLGA